MRNFVTPFGRIADGKYQRRVITQDMKLESH